MNDIRELAQEWGVEPEPLIEALEAAKERQDYSEVQRRIIASAEPAECAHRLRQARKAIEALPLRARVHLHWRLAERIAYGPYGLNAEQVRQVMEDPNWVDEILAALCEPMDAEGEDPKQELRWLVLAWQRAGGQLLVEGSYDLDLIDFLKIAYRHLGGELTVDAIRRRLDRIRRSPLGSEG